MAAEAEAAFAKINLCLHVVGKREDGYHLLDSLVAFADFGDAVSAEPADGLTLRIVGPFAQGLDDGPQNLVMRAAQALRGALGEARGAALTLTKNLPVAAGIGGGSADAAATLRVLQRLWRRRLPDDQLAALALTLGADTPVCLNSRAAAMRGVGEDVTPARLPDGLGLVLINPLRPVSTAAVFRALRIPADRLPPVACAYADDAALLSALRASRNDLEPPALTIEPTVADCLRAIAAAPGCRLGRMSGSGGTVFGLFDDAAAAENAAAWLRGAYPSWWIAAGRLRG